MGWIRVERWVAKRGEVGGQEKRGGWLRKERMGG